MKRATFVFIFITVLLDMLALGIIVPVLPKLVIQFKGGDTASAATIYGLFGTVWAGMQFLFAPVLGAISDRFGRRPVILLSTLGLGLDYILMAVAPTLGWLFVGRVVSGITSAGYATGFAYIADVTPAERRAAKYGMLGAAFGVGFIIGPAVGGLLGAIHLRLPFWVAAALSLTGTAYGYFILPESLPADRRAAFDLKKANPLGSLDLLRAHGTIAGLAAAVFLFRVAHDAMPALFVIYGDFRFAWSERTIGLVLAAVGASSMIVQAVLVGRSVKRFGERTSMLIGFAFGVAGYALYGLAPTGAVFAAAVPLSALFGLTYPSLQGIITARVGADQQGRLQGALASITGIAGVLAPLLFTQTFAVAVNVTEPVYLPGAPFLLAGLLLIGAAFIAGRATAAAR